MKMRWTAVGWAAAALAVLSPAGCGDTNPSAPHDVNHPPLIASLSKTILHDARYEQRGSASEPDGDAVDVRATDLPSWLSFDSNTLTLSGTPGVEAVGDHPVTLVASDGDKTFARSSLLTVVANTTSLVREGSWVGQGYPFGHDGEPVESDHFVVFSGFSRQEERQYVAEALEGHFLDFKTSFDIASNDELEPWDDGTRIDVLTLRYQGTDVLWTGTSYRYGFIVHAPDSPRFAREGYTRTLYDQLLRHELMHVFEHLLVGRYGNHLSVEKWFHEGIATVMGGIPPNQIRNVGLVTQWRADMEAYPGKANPIRIKTWSDYPEQLQDDAMQLGRYYMLFELAVRYLLDPDGGGCTLEDVKNMYLDIRQGSYFAKAFEENMGIRVEDFEADFFSLIGEYLS